MREKQETIADIVAEMRTIRGFPVPYAPSGHNGVWTADLVEFAARIEAAAQRVASKMHALQRELWNGKKMGEFAFALALDGFASALSATTAPAKGGAK